MILDAIILDNFGAFRGRQEALLTPENDKPIILFGGMNGGGKTTLLDAVQLAFYGPKARLSNRGRLGYREYLRESIHHGSDPREGAGVTVRFRRTIGGEVRRFELQRNWHEEAKGIEESVRVLCNDVIDEVLTEHWEQTIETYLPSGIAHLFFFDGEQIRELAEGDHAAEILGTAVHSLLGLDLVDRLEADLKVFERRKRAEGLDRETAQRFAEARSEFEQIDREIEKAAMQEGVLVNEAGRLGKELRAKEELFRSEGGELYLRRNDLETELNGLRTQKKHLESQFRELVAGPLPLVLVEDLLGEVEKLAQHEAEVKRASLLLDALEARDREILASLRTEKLADEPIQKITRILEIDRCGRVGLAKAPLILDADDSLAPQLAHLRSAVLPAAKQQASDLTAKLAILEEAIARLEDEIARIPAAERIALIQSERDAVSKLHRAKMAELDAVRIRKQALQRQRLVAESKLDKLSEHEMEARFAEDDRKRILKHSQRVRETLERFRIRVVQRHTARIESLMLESFRRLLRKTDLVRDLTINPETFEVTLAGRDGKVLPFDRLSAGERQLLATSLLWGLARASGRPVPTIIDTPLGRLDSSHRRHLINRYFPNASHQVLLLSTDEEIVGSYYVALKPYITRSYLLSHNEATGETKIESGYFNV
ncbi:DNA sulfur modification protein DndD [Desulfatirhabdium butyrativorans]|uniref:DNA sulfur modification protein DndD n=1 Tax=Desulfatirhabdium butyrativorans TaxID=340467 RepID=UPI0003FD53C2|nr:DNA sulfur modification protein DndD [Desulfatirhabdium butyrativorans]